MLDTASPGPRRPPPYRSEAAVLPPPVGVAGVLILLAYGFTREPRPEAHRPHAEDRDDGDRGAGPGGLARLAPVRWGSDAPRGAPAGQRSPRQPWRAAQPHFWGGKVFQILGG